MTLTIDHPIPRHGTPVRLALAALAMAAIVAVVVFQLSGAFSTDDNAPSAPAVVGPAVDQGPNVGLAPDWTSRQAAVDAGSGDTSVDQGPNAGLPPDWRSRQAVNQGPNADLAPDRISQQAATLAGQG
jgi:hypothetical protein